MHVHHPPEQPPSSHATAPARARALPLAGALLCLALWSAPCLAVDGIAVGVGRGPAADVAHVALQWHWHRHWAAGRHWRFSGYWDAALGRWRSRSARAGSEIADLGLTPVIRLEHADARGLYFEGGIGAHLLSRTRLSADKRLSTAFQFGEHVAIGLRFGPQGRYDLQARLQHVSNADIKEPNPGFNFAELRLTYWLR